MKNKNIQKGFVKRINADPESGLTSQQVQARVESGLVNVQSGNDEKSTAQILASNLFTFFNIVLFCIALVFISFVIYFKSIGRDDIVNKYFGFSKFFFLIPAIMNVTMGTFQEIRSLKVIRKLRIVTVTKCRAIRDGKLTHMEAKDIVIDDILVIGAGDQASADLEVISGEVYVDESMLTGEADNVKKLPGDTILSGSFIIVGDAKCRVTEIGDNTFAATLSKKAKSASRHKSELMSTIMGIIKINTVALVLVVATVAITLVVKIAQSGGDPSIWNGLTLSVSDPLTWGLIAVTGGSFGIGVIPSGLVLTTSVTMVVSIAQLAKKKTLIQELYSLENLSRIDVICLDKTGTLTDGTMEVADVKTFIPEEEVAKYARDLTAVAGERNATAEAIYQRFGISEDLQYKEKIPFSSATKYSGLIYNDGKKLLMGAPEYLLDKNDKALDYVTERAKEGMRVIAMTLDGKLIAFIVISDHIRDTAPDTLKFFRENGVSVKVISGDNPITVSKIAESCGIRNADRYISLEGVPLEDIPDIADEYTVFARVSPEQKEALVEALQAKGHKVAMTGDGVNDILALRKSNSSITFAKATDAAKSCSDVVLLDNDFSHLKEVVGEGRRVIGNMQKTSVLYLMKSVAVFIIGFALIPFAKGQMWFSIENMYMLEAAVIGTGGFLLSLEPRRTPIKGSFLKKIATQSVAAGMLAAAAIILPIILNCLPRSLGYEPFISDDNVKPMMTMLLTFSGFVVVFSMCIPFNRYRTIAMAALSGVALTLGFALPSSYIGGQTIGKQMFEHNGGSIFDSQIGREFFRPWNSETVKNLFSSSNNFFLIRIFLYIAIPIFILVMFAAENYARKEFGKDVKAGRAFRSGRRMMLSSGFVLMLHAALSVIELLWTKRQLVPLSSSFSGLEPAQTAISVIFIILYFIIGFIGYKLWKDPTKKMIRVAFASGALLLLMTVFS
ncbi:MAG: HAD-IC family P-type ATPase, partial [Clostridia bacterium]|nr:HAD-IC family P-type ATPase [Clostridia bacterium]